MRWTHRATRLAGVVAPTVLLLTALTGILLTPTYRWPTDPISVVGAVGSPIATPFGIGIALAGVLLLGFSVFLWHTTTRAVAVATALAGLGLVGGGVFPAGSGMHDVAALYFLTAWFPPARMGVHEWRAGTRPWGVLYLVLGALAIGIWLPYDLGLAWAQIGLGAAELVTILAWGIWSATTAVRAPERDVPATDSVAGGSA